MAIDIIILSLLAGGSIFDMIVYTKKPKHPTNKTYNKCNVTSGQTLKPVSFISSGQFPKVLCPVSNWYFLISNCPRSKIFSRLVGQISFILHSKLEYHKGLL